MRTLIGIISAQSRFMYEDAQRATWIPLLPPGVDYRFFLGNAEREPEQDEVFLNVDDTYQGLPQKVQAMFSWSQANGYDFCMKLDDDCMLLSEAWLRSGFDQFDYTGNTILSENPPHVLVPYGFAYILSRKAMEHVISAELPMDNNDESWVAHILAQHGIVLHVDPRYFLHMGRRNEAKRGSKERPLREFNRPMERQAMPGTFCWCIFLNWLGFHLTPTEEVLREYMKVWERIK